MSAPTTTTDRSARTGRLARLRSRWEPGPWSREATALTVVIVVLALLGLVRILSFEGLFGA
ncbi:MAG: hypothetical protein WD010_02355, partial [Nitriliruptor sp.]